MVFISCISRVGECPVSPVWGEYPCNLPVSPVRWELCKSEGCVVAVPGLCEVTVSLESRSFFIYTMHMDAQAMDQRNDSLSANSSPKLEGPPF